jgi:hypothetical protein
VRVVAPHFVAGLLMRNEWCVAAAPILRWCIGRSRHALRKRFRALNYQALVVRARK